MRAPKVSVIMSVFNGEPYLTEAVESILGQEFGDFEFLIVDDGSTDNTPSILQSFQDDRISIIRQQNMGLPKSLNRAVRMAKGNYIARMDADDISLPSRLRLQVALLDQDCDIVLVGCYYKAIREDGTVSFSKKIPMDPVQRCWLLHFRNIFAHGSIMARKQAIVKCGGYDEYFTYSQDFDLWARLCTPCNTGVIPRFLYLWRHGGTKDCNSLSKQQIQRRNGLRICTRNLTASNGRLSKELCKRMEAIYYGKVAAAVEVDVARGLLDTLDGFCSRFGIGEAKKKRLKKEVVAQVIQALAGTHDLPPSSRLKSAALVLWVGLVYGRLSRRTTAALVLKQGMIVLKRTVRFLARRLLEHSYSPSIK